MDSTIQLENFEKKCEEASALLKVLSHPGRLKILCHLTGGEKSVSEIETRTGLSQSYTSQFLNKMKAEGLISSRKEGVITLYRITDEKVQKLMGAMYTIFCSEDNS